MPPAITPTPARVDPKPVTGTSGVGVAVQEQLDCSVHCGFRQYPLEQIRLLAQSVLVVHAALHAPGAGVLVGVAVSSSVAVGVYLVTGVLVGIGVLVGVLVGS